MVEYFAMVDRRDADEFLGWYADDATFHFANQPPANGKAAIRAALEAFYALITSMRHERIESWSGPASGAFEAIAHFVTRDGTPHDCPRSARCAFATGSSASSASSWMRRR